MSRPVRALRASRLEPPPPHVWQAVVDELSLGLAPVIVKRMMPVLERVAAGGVGVLLIEQFAHVALSLSQGAYVLEGGRIQYAGTAAELADDPDLLKKAYLLGAG